MNKTEKAIFQSLDGGEIKINIPKYRALIIGLSSTIILVSSLFFFSNLDVKDLVAVFTSGIVCTTLVYHSLNLTMSYEVNQIKISYDNNKLKYDRKVQAISMIGEWHKGELVTATMLTRDFFSIDSNVQKLIDIIDLPENKDIRNSIFSILNYFERVALACESDVVDEDLIKDYHSGLFSYFYLTSIDFIKKRQRQMNDNKMFEKFEKYNNKWNKVK